MAGIRMNQAWMKDARALVNTRNDDIKNFTKNALGDLNESDNRNCLNKRQIKKPSATCLNYLIIILFGLSWIILIFVANFRTKPIIASSFSQAYSKTIEQLSDVGINKDHLYLRSSNYDNTKKIYTLLFEDSKSIVTYQINFDIYEKRIVNYTKK